MTSTTGVGIEGKACADCQGRTLSSVKSSPHRRAAYFDLGSLFLVLAIGASSTSASESLGWRGDGSGRFPEAHPPTKIDEATATWKTPMPGAGSSQPVILEDLVVLTAEPAWIIGLDRTDGTERWRVDLGAPTGKVGSDYSNAFITPASDGTTIYAAFLHGVVGAVSLEGRQVWKTSLDSGRKGMKVSCAALALLDGKVVLMGGKAGPGSAVALDAATGNEVWRTSPVLRLGDHGGTNAITSITFQDRQLLLLPGEILDPKDGAIVCALPAVADCGTSPVVEGSTIYISTGDTYDRAPQGVVAVTLSDSGGTIAAQQTWRHDFPAKTGCSIVCPLVDGTTVWTVIRGKKQCLFGLSAANGETITLGFSFSYDSPGHVFRARPMLAGGHLYLAMPTGRVVCVKASGEASSLTNEGFIEALPSNPVAAGATLVIRTKGHCYGFIASP